MRRTDGPRFLWLLTLLAGCSLSDSSTGAHREDGGETEQETDPSNEGGDSGASGDGDDAPETRGDGDASSDEDTTGPSDGGEDDDDPGESPTPLAGFAHARRVTLDTTSAGADVADDVENYPLAVQLTNANFDFSEANAQGEDLRFTTAEGAQLSYAIEHYSQADARAALWVKLDVRGNDDTQSFVMHWGNPDVADESDAKAVFSTDEGFLGVFHLGEGAGNEAGGFKDATANAAHATGMNLSPGESVEGRVGRAVALDHDKKQWLRVGGESGLFDEYERLTYSIWTYAESHTVDYQCAFSKGEKGFRLHYYGSHEWDDNGGKHVVEMCAELSGGQDFCPLHDPPSAGTDVAPGKWFHWVAVHDYPRVTLYLNGREEVSETSDAPFTSGPSLPVAIGTNSSYPDKRSWDGVLDEARVMKVAKGAGWAKLEYESQREGQTLLRFGPTPKRASRKAPMGAR